MSVVEKLRKRVGCGEEYCLQKSEYYGIREHRILNNDIGTVAFAVSVYVMKG